jgi:RHS repeat-associated protein
VGAAAVPYPFSYQYNLAGGLTQQTYPSGRVVVTAYDGLNRPVNVSAGTTTYVSNTTYASSGALASIVSPVATQAFTFDQGGALLRQQVTGITVALPNNSGTPLNLGYSYCPSGSASCTSNNGNVLGATIAANGTTVSNQSYVYDGLNRLALAVENPVGTPSATNPVCAGVAGTSWCQQFGYDIYGNNTITSVNLGGIVAPTGFDPATNRIVPNGGTSGWNYDLAGDINRDAAGVTYAFDADGRMVSACPTQQNPAACSNQWASGQIGYTYDGNGARVQMTRVDGTTTTFVYDAAGRLAADFGGAVASGTQYLFADTLGSTRMVITSTSTSTCVTSRLDYLPFGYEVPSSVGLRQNITDACAGQSLSTYSDDPVFRQKFTGKERDAETGLDYFGARYFSGVQGRFTSPDPVLNAERTITNPQRWNRYAYVINNPLAKVDPTGAQDSLASYELQQAAVFQMTPHQRELYEQQQSAMNKGTLVGAAGVVGFVAPEIAAGLGSVGRFLAGLAPAATRFLSDETGTQSLSGFSLKGFANALFPKGSLVLENMAAGQLANGGSVGLNVRAVGNAIQVGLPMVGDPEKVTGTLGTLLKAIPAAAADQGLTSVIVRAQNVSDDLAPVLTGRYGFTQVQGTTDYVLTIQLPR